MKNLIFLLIVICIVSATEFDYYDEDYDNEIDYLDFDENDFDYFDEYDRNDIDYFEDNLEDRTLRRNFRTNVRVCPDNTRCIDNDDCDWYVVIHQMYCK